MPVVFRAIDSPAGALPDGDTHVYITPLTDPAARLDLLTDEERARADRFRLARARDQFICARGHLRALLGHYLGLTPRAIPLLYAEGGKPYLPPDLPLHFNVSHTDGMAGVALGRTRVGIDVERDRPIPDVDALVGRFFTSREHAEFLALPLHDRPTAFLRAWTRKEALLKAIGRGVMSLDCCEVTFAPGDPPAVRVLEGDPDAAGRWEMHAWEPASGYVAAVAAEKTK